MVAAVVVAVLAAGCSPAAPVLRPDTVYISGSRQLIGVDAISLHARTPLALPGPVAGAVYDAKRKRLDLVVSGANQWITVDAVHWHILSRINLGLTPTMLQLAADADHAYVLGHAYGQGRLLRLDLDRGSISASTAVSGDPVALASTADHRRLIVASSNQTLSIFQTAGLRLDTSLHLKAAPTAAAGLPFGDKVFVLCGDDVAVIDAARGQLLTYLPVGPQAQVLLVKPDGGEVYVSNASGTVSVIDTSTNVVSGTMAAGLGAGAMAVSSDGQTLYVANAQAGTISVLNLTDRTTTAVVQVGEQPTGLQLAAGGGELFAADSGSGDLAVLRSNTDPNNPNTLITLLPAPPQPRLLMAAPTP